MNADTQATTSENPEKSSFQRWNGTDSYIADEGLIAAVNVAVALQRPLLIKGEPGTGKTLLAHAIADGLGMALHTWHIKSTTRAQDGCWIYDAVARLQDSRFGDRDVRDVSQYIKLGPLGQAFSSEKRAVLLIDEIDKADIEFPNDLLHELDAMRFVVTETGEEIKAKHRPIVVISSNAEKELPDAFLRRCVFHYITFPDAERLEMICRVHHPDVEDKLLAAALRRFLALRSVKHLRKRPTTSELVDWIAGLRLAGIDAEKLHNTLPFIGVLLKDESDAKKAKQAGVLAGDGEGEGEAGNSGGSSGGKSGSSWRGWR